MSSPELATPGGHVSPPIGTVPRSAALFSLRGVSQERAGVGILHEIALELPHTAITAVVGPSGAGKTSLLRLLNRLDDPARGEVCFEGRPLGAYPVAALRRRVGFVFQAPVMFPGTVEDNLRIARELDDGSAAPPGPSPQDVVTAVGLASGDLDREALRLSGGEQQRVSIARALMTRPDVLLLDEPTSALDPEVAERLLLMIAGLTRERGLAAVMVTHRLSEARHLSTYTVMLESGRLVEAGPTDRLFTSAASPRARAYLASAD